MTSKRRLQQQQQHVTCQVITYLSKLTSMAASLSVVCACSRAQVYFSRWRTYTQYLAYFFAVYGKTV